MTVLERLVAIIAPHECLGCAREGRVLCRGCIAKLTPAPSRCYRCYRATTNSATCQSCRPTSPLAAVHAATPYKDLAAAVVRRLKFGSARAAAVDIAEVLPLLTEGIVVPVPTASSRARRRGYDQAVLIAKAYACRARLPYLACLSRQGQTQQVGAGRQQRRQQLTGAFRARNNVAGKRLILIDDVSTTGASLEAAAQALKRAGARSIVALVFAQA